jgi:L-iditol 2-dehydrogenase
MAEYFRVPRANLVDTLVLPAALSFADGSLVEPLACVVKSLRRAFPLDFKRRVAPAPSFDGEAPLVAALAGRTVYVIGAGVMGLLHIATARALGATVYASDFHPGRRLAAERLGATAAFDPPEALERLTLLTRGRRSDAVICGPGTPGALAAAVAATGADGTVVMFTPLEPEERFSFDQSAAYFRDIKLVASYSCGPSDTRDALGLIARGVVSARRIGVREFAFPHVEEAYDAMRAATVTKAVVTFSNAKAS